MRRINWLTMMIACLPVVRPLMRDARRELPPCIKMVYPYASSVLDDCGAEESEFIISSIACCNARVHTISRIIMPETSALPISTMVTLMPSVLVRKMCEKGAYPASLSLFYV